MTGLSSTAWRGRGRFSRPDGSNAEEDSREETATTGPPTTAGAEKNATTEVRFPQRLSIRWTPSSTRTGTGWKGGVVEQRDGDG
jgi:hypothetical protein